MTSHNTQPIDIHSPDLQLRRLLTLARDEDLGTGDVTTQCLIPADVLGTGKLIAKEPLVISGQPFIETLIEVFKERLPLSQDQTVNYTSYFPDGTKLTPGAIIGELRGPSAFILTIERTILNFIQRLSGVASYAHHLVELVAQSGVTDLTILDTRKTTPGWRELEKYAITSGGANNHRLGLYDSILIKNNHIDTVLRCGRFQSISEMLRYLSSSLAPSGDQRMKVEIEVRGEAELREVLETTRELSGSRSFPDVIMLDNFTPQNLRRAIDILRVEFNNQQVKIEVSGGINADNITDYLVQGVNFISVGALTHSPQSSDIALHVATTDNV